VNIFKRLLRAHGLFFEDDLQVEVVKRVERLCLKPGDVIVISTPHLLSADAAENMRASLQSVIRDPTRRVLVLDGGVKMEILPGSSEPAK
jgi:hypothetical protein